MEDLKQENERLKECIQELASDNLNTIQEMDNERRRVEQLKEENEKLQETLQEIKAIAEKTIDIYYPDYYDEGFEEDIVTEFAKQVLDLITKAEGNDV